MITYTCDQCNGPIGRQLLITATTPDSTKEFCSVVCLSAWATMSGKREVPEVKHRASRTPGGQVISPV